MKSKFKRQFEINRKKEPNVVKYLFVTQCLIDFKNKLIEKADICWPWGTLKSTDLKISKVIFLSKFSGRKPRILIPATYELGALWIFPYY